MRQGDLDSFEDIYAVICMFVGLHEYFLLNVQPFYLSKSIVGGLQVHGLSTTAILCLVYVYRWQVVAAWEAQGNNWSIAALDGEGVVPDRMAAGLAGEMTGEPVPIQPKGESSRHAPLHSSSSASIVLRHCPLVHHAPNQITYIQTYGVVSLARLLC